MKTVTIEQLLHWAFTFELCKVGSEDGLTAVSASSWSFVSEMAVLGTMIDRTPNHYGVIPSFVGEGEPHPDAVQVGQAVRGLAGIGFDIPAGWNPFPEWPDEHGLVAEAVERVVAETVLKGDRLSGRHLVALVTTSAILERGPDWSAEFPGLEMVSANGRPRWFVMKRAKDTLGRAYDYEADGYNRKAGRPVAGAYRKYALKGFVRSAVLSRLDWQLWQDALQHLAGALDGRLAAHQLTPFWPDRQPWARPRRVAVSG